MSPSRDRAGTPVSTGASRRPISATTSTPTEPLSETPRMAMLKKRMRPDETPGPVDSESGTPTSSQVQLVRRLMEESTPPSGTYIGGRVLMDTLVDGVRCRLIREQATTAPITLSPREREIARMISRGLPNKSIAQALEISVWTVGTYLRRIFSKLGVTSRAAMVAKIMEIGVLDQEPGEPTPPPLRTTDIRDEVRSTSTPKVRPAPWR